MSKELLVSFDEKNTWLFGVIAVAGYATYLVLLFTQLGDRPLAEADYVWPMVGTILGAIVVGILGGIVLGILNPKDARKSDVRDRQVYRFGEQVGNSIVVIGGIAALVLCFFEVPHFWIANLLYLAFVLSGILSVLARLGAYHRGLGEW